MHFVISWEIRAKQRSYQIDNIWNRWTGVFTCCEGHKAAFVSAHPQYAANKCQEVNHKTITAVVRVTNQTHLHLNQWSSQHNSYSSWKNLEK